MIYKPYKYQTAAQAHLLTHPQAGLFIDMGLGKTVCTLTVLTHLLGLEICKPLVIAPKRVALSVWPAEIQKWDHTKHLTYSVIAGTAAQRAEALKKKADIHIIGVDNVVWLVNFLRGHWPYDCLILDELSKFKNPDAYRFRALKMIRPKVDYVWGLTGTPAPNGLIDLWAQIYLLDRGERLYNTVTAFRGRFFQKKDYGYGYEPYDETSEVIHDKISDICISMKTEDYLELPDLIHIPVEVKLSTDIQKKYNKFERDQVTEILGKDITAVTAGALVTKLMQFSNGAIYDEDKTVHQIHDEKLEALEEIIEEANGQPVLVFYSFKHDRDKILKKFPGTRTLHTPKDIEDWNNKKIKILLAHPASAGHGLNLQEGGNIMIWYGPTYNLELWQQAIKRLHRQGQLLPVRVYTLIGVKTIDEDITQRIQAKTNTQDALLEAVKFRIDKYSTEFV